MKTIPNPNFSIVVPGGCNCNCNFCFWRKDSGATGPKNRDAWLDNLQYILEELPEQFTQISITGGEPTISPYFKDVIDSIDKTRWSKVVLTTNGSNLQARMNDMHILFKNTVDFVNISRHSEYTELNNQRFGLVREAKVLPSPSQLSDIIETINKMGKTATANYVLTEGITHRPNEFIIWAKRVGFSGVCFRKEHNKGCTLEPTIYEEAYNKYTITSHSECPVCRSDTQTIQGIPVIWTASIPEPSQELDLIYEVVLHPDGTLSADWSKEIPLWI